MRAVPADLSAGTSNLWKENSMEFAKNTCVTVQIEDMGAEGEGIGKVDGFTLFVKDAIIGDVVEAKIVKARRIMGTSD